MKIGYIFADWKQSIGLSTGLSVHIREITDALGELGHNVFIVAANTGEEEVGTPRSSVIHEITPHIPVLSPYYPTIRRFWPRKKPESAIDHAIVQEDISRTTWSPKVVFWDVSRRLGERVWYRYFQLHARRIIQREQPDALYERCARASSAGVKLATEFNLPLILEMNTSLTFANEWGNKHSPLFPYLARRSEQKICRRADRVIVVSPSLRSYLLDLNIPAEKIELMLNAADPERFTTNPTQIAHIRAKYGLDQELVVGFVGSLKPWHGVDVLLDSAKLVLQHCRAVHFLVVGDGPMRTTLEEHVKREGLSSFVTFTGYIPRREVPTYINAMDVALAPYPKLPSFHYSPIKIFEYMAAAKPIITSRYVDTEAVITDHSDGLLVEPGNASMLAQAILELLKDKDLRDRLGTQARQTVEEHFTWRGNARRIVTLYEELQAAGARRPNGNHDIL